ncbi:hypothetical protein ACFQ5N_01060 [Lutibacter holmesii]|uniref:ParB/Sulfiredoxin domain-containing protein n=1 Tax=Lutibacter holmesii TaxID=1137985 RepID=A0ABW3WJ12_9FLAO
MTKRALNNAREKNNREIPNYENWDNDYIEQYQILLIEYLKKTSPEKLNFNPNFIDIIDGRLRFGLAKHYGVLSVGLTSFLEYI